jgi:hypothetical protein
MRYPGTRSKTGNSRASLREFTLPTRMLVADRAALFVVLLCLLIAIPEFLLLGLVKSVVVVSAVGDGVLLLSWLHWGGLTALEQCRRLPRVARRYQADAASCDPSGKKYCVPLIGAETFRNSSCKS